ncbi:hypothetical protein BDAP_000698 [Binucleata daphniae]
MTQKDKYYNIFSSEGKLIQIENALQCLESLPPIVVLKSNDAVYSIARKKYQKLAHTPSHVFRINKNVYGTITGLPGDVDNVKYNLQKLSANMSFDLGYEPSADIIARLFADKMQKTLQNTDQRQPAFSLGVYGFDTECLLFYVDTSAVCYPFKAFAAGEHRVKMTNFLEKHYNKDETLEVGLECIGLNIGNNYGPNDVEVAVLKRDCEIEYLENEQIDNLLTKIFEKY